MTGIIWELVSGLGLSSDQPAAVLCPLSSPSDLTLICLSVHSASRPLIHTWQSADSDCVCGERPLCRGCCACYPPWPLVSVTRGLRRSEVPGGAEEGAAIGWVRGPGAGRRPRAAPSPVTVSSLSLTVCSQLDFFCPQLKASADKLCAAIWGGLSVRARRCHPCHNADVSPLHGPPPRHSLYSHFGFFNALPFSTAE